MKRFICFIVALVMAAMTLAACDTQPAGGDGTDGGDGLIHGSATGNIGEFAVGGGFYFPYVWGDFAFQTDACEPNKDGYIDYIVFHDMDDPSGGWLPLCCDLTRGENSDKFNVRIESSELIVDGAATAKNGGVPVFIIAYTVERTDKDNSRNREYETKIASFDMKSRKLTILKEGLNEIRIGSIFTYRNTLYFGTSPVGTSSGENSVYIINKIDFDGSGYAVLEIEEGTGWFHLDYIADDAIYYSRGGKIYSSALDFSGFTYLFDGYSVCCSDDEYLYYQTAEDLTMADYDTSFSLCRRKLGDPLSEEETVLSSDIITARSGGGCSFGDGYFYYDNDMSDGTAVFYSYDCRTGEHKKIFTAENSRYWVVSSTDDRVIIQCLDGTYYFVKKDTGEYTTIVRWHNA